MIVCLCLLRICLFLWSVDYGEWT